MQHHQVVPDVIDADPQCTLEVTYPDNLEVSMGMILTPTQVKECPTFRLPDMTHMDKISHFTLIMTDPDAPSRKDPKFREWHHWLVGNIPGYNLDTGRVLSHYIGAGPPEGTDLHRYVFLLYKQPTVLSFDEPVLLNNSGKNRAYFNSRAFAKKYNLGMPMAGNFFMAKFDTYVPQLYNQLSTK